MSGTLIKSNLQHAKQAALRSSTAAPHRRAGKKGRHDGGDDADADPVRLLVKAEVLDRLGVTFVTLWKWMRTDFFPRARDLDGKPVWVEAEVEDFINKLPIKPYRGDAGYEPKPQIKALMRRAAKTAGGVG
jgi:predicted DNA-binding transcriptional regulator AlpA